MNKAMIKKTGERAWEIIRGIFVIYSGFMILAGGFMFFPMVIERAGNPESYLPVLYLVTFLIWGVVVYIKGIKMLSRSS